MPLPRAIQLRDSVYLRLRSTERVLGAEVLATGEHPLLRIHSGVVGLKDEHFDEGIDIDLYDHTEGHFAYNETPVLEFRPQRLEVLVSGPIELRPVVRRSSQRNEVGLEVQVQSFCGKWSANGITSDLGGGGMSFATDEAIVLSIGENIRIQLQIPDQLVKATARVAWVADEGPVTRVGLAFVEVDRAGHDHLYQFIYGLRRQKHTLPY